MERFPFHTDEYGRENRNRSGGGSSGTGRPLDIVKTEYFGKRSYGQYGKLRAWYCRSEGLRFYLGRVVRLVHRDGKAKTLQYRRYLQPECGSLDVKGDHDCRSEAFASVYAF